VESDYIGFLVSVETEARLLKHIQKCRGCRDKLAPIYTKERDPVDELETLFAVDLPEKLLNSSAMLDCPLRDNYMNADDYIEARIKWRLEKLKNIVTNAEIELKQIGSKIKES
jgi:hypothetical protein